MAGNVSWLYINFNFRELNHKKWVKINKINKYFTKNLKVSKTYNY